MYKPRSRYARKGRKAPVRKYGRKSYAKPRRGFVKAVKKIISSQIEDKVVTTYGVNQSIAYAGTATDPAYLSLVPAIAQGDSAQGRIGNQVKLKKAVIRGFVNINTVSVFGTSIIPLYCKMWICRRKGQNFYDTINNADWDNFFQAGSTVLGFQGNLLDTMLYPNNDYWTITKTKMCMLGPNTNLPATTTVGTVLTAGFPDANSRISVPFSFDVTKELGGTLKFNDNTFRPQNKELYLVFQVVPIDGSTPAALALAPEYNYVYEVKYEDA